MVDLVKRSFLPMLSLTKNIEGGLHICKFRSLPVGVLPTSFLFLPESLNFLLDSC
jgi:hypothetical protein